MGKGAKRLFFTGLALFALSVAARADGPPAPDWFTDPRNHWDWENTANEGLYVSPLNQYRVTSHYGRRRAPIEGASEWHQALDLQASEGTPVFAAFPGVIVATSDNWGRAFPKEIEFIASRANPEWRLRNTSWNSTRLGSFDVGCGNYIIEGIFPSWNPTKIFYPKGTLGDWDWGGFIVYCHLSRISVPTWWAVRVQDQVGQSGRTGTVTGPHLHVAIRLTPDHVPEKVKGTCVPNPESWNFARTCSVDPDQLLQVDRSYLKPNAPPDR
jgi:murein DD-endopeptidase MepM/ murein hydrolase activator NlpD